MNTPSAGQDAQELIRRIGRVKAAMDNGFSRLGPSLGRDPVAGRLLGAASRCLAAADAIAILCRENHANEALPLARSLAGTAVAMRWLSAGSSFGRLAVLDEELRAPDWGRLFSDDILAGRMREAGMQAAEMESAMAAMAEGRRQHAAGSSGGLPWAHAFPENAGKGAEPEKTLALALAALGNALRALDARWPGEFPGAEETCSR